MKTLTKIAVLALALGAVVGPVVRAGDAAPSREAQDELQRYLLVDCEVGEEEPALNRVLPHADALLPELVRLLREGPSESMRVERGRALDEAWRQRVEFMDSDPRFGLDPDARMRVRVTSPQDFVARGLRRFDFTCREKAVVALGAIGTPEALRALRAARSVVGEGLDEAITAALARSRNTGREAPRVHEPRTRSAGRRGGSSDRRH